MPKNSFDEAVVFCIEKILFDLTDGVYDPKSGRVIPRNVLGPECSNGTRKKIKLALKLTDIQRELESRYGIKVSADKIDSVLRSKVRNSTSEKPNKEGTGKNPPEKIDVTDETPTKLRDLFGATLWCAKTSSSKNAALYFFVERKLSKMQATYLAQFVRSTSSGGKDDDIARALSLLLCEYDREKFESEIKEILGKANPSQVSLMATLRTTDIIQEAIEAKKTISYRYVGRDPEGVWHLGRVPLCIEINEGYHYVAEKSDKGYVLKRIDQIRDIEIDKKQFDISPKQLKKEQKQAREFIHGAVNRMAGENDLISVRCHADYMQRYVEEVFGNKDGFKEKGGVEGQYQDYEFRASIIGTKIQALKWAEWFEVLQPVSLRNEVIASIKDNVYGPFDERVDYQIESILVDLTSGKANPNTGEVEAENAIPALKIRSELKRRFGVELPPNKIEDVLGKPSEEQQKKEKDRVKGEEFLPVKVKELVGTDLYCMRARGVGKKTYNYFVMPRY